MIYGSYDYFMDKINIVWNVKSPVTQWLGMENMQVDILRSDVLTHEQKIDLLKQCIDAYTRRGHFI